MLLNRWMDAILHYFGGRDEQNSGISARRDFGVAAGSRPLGRRLLHQNYANQKKHNFDPRGHGLILPNRRLPPRPNVCRLRHGHEFHISCYEQFALKML